MPLLTKQYFSFNRCIYIFLVYYVALPTLQAFHLLDSLFSCLSDCKVLTMPDHRPHAHYVDAPKWERRWVVLFSGVCLFRNPLRAVAKIIIFNWDYHFPLLSAIYESDSCVTDAHCFLFRIFNKITRHFRLIYHLI